MIAVLRARYSADTLIDARSGRSLRVEATPAYLPTCAIHGSAGPTQRGRRRSAGPRRRRRPERAAVPRPIGHMPRRRLPWARLAGASIADAGALSSRASCQSLSSIAARRATILSSRTIGAARRPTSRPGENFSQHPPEAHWPRNARPRGDAGQGADRGVRERTHRGARYPRASRPKSPQLASPLVIQLHNAIFSLK